MKNLLLFVLMVFLCSAVTGQQNFFTDAGENRVLQTNGNRVLFPEKYRAYSLNVQGLRTFLWSLPSEQSLGNNRNQAPVIELPMPDGQFAKFRVWESSVMAPALAVKFPEIRTFLGQGIDDPYATVRFDYNPYFGFSAQILSVVSGRIMIDPYARGDINSYISYYTRDAKSTDPFICNFQNDLSFIESMNAGPCRGTELYTYRLALACTGEYAIKVAGPAPTIPVVAAAMNTAVARVTGVYELELSIRLMLISNNDLLIYLDPNTDPYTNNNGNSMLGENIANINAVIGQANYDIGHVFSTGGGGVAFLGVVCTADKAGGVTGQNNPVGDPFYIDYVAHEIGHQFGGNHTFNSETGSCGGGNRNASTAYEVGSGTSIIAYAGICGTNNIQRNSDPYMHTATFDEISNFVSGAGGSCPVITPTFNILPVITAMNNNGAKIPLNTPFTLSGTATTIFNKGTDADDNSLTYSWEQWDLGPATDWNGGNANTTSPLFKSRIPKTTGERTFPDIAVILAGYPANPADSMGGLKGETLPTQARALKFRLTVRNNSAGGGGVVTGGDGCGFTGPFQINTIAGTGPFIVTVPNGGESWPAGSSQTITWNPAGTDVAPISTTHVKISLSTDGGFTYPTVITASTPNDGSELVTIPTILTSTARVKVEAVGNIFFDISNADFAISGFSFNSPAPATSSCPAPASMAITLGTISTGGFSNPITLSAIAGVPAGTNVTFGTNPVTPGDSSVVTLNNTNTLGTGSYIITVQGVASGVPIQTRDLTFTINPGIGSGPLLCPANLSVFISAAPFALSALGGTPVGGTYSGTGVSGGLFDPAAAGPGVHTITYSSAVSPTGCIFSCTFTITVVEGTSTLFGTVYTDFDGNCVYTDSANDKGKPWKMVKAVDINSSFLTYYAFTDSNGAYSIALPPGETYEVSLVNNSSTTENAICSGTMCNSTNVNGHKVYCVNTFPAVLKDFFIQPNCDATVVVSGHKGTILNCGTRPSQRPCPTGNWKYCVTFTNNGDIAFKEGTIFELVLDPTMSFSGAVPDLCGIAGTYNAASKTFQWITPTCTAFPRGFSCTVCVGVNVNSIPAGGTWNTTARIKDSLSCCGGNQKLPRTFILQEGNACSCDPNDKQVSPIGCGPGGNIGRNIPITYITRFQNVGSGPAHNVIIKDTLDNDLDLSSFTILQSSHSITHTQINPGNELVIEFTGIELIDSLSDPVGSNGYVTYSISPLAGLPDGTVITNNAAIYFDLNTPVITNNVINTIRDNPVPSVTCPANSIVCINTPTFTLSALGGSPSGGTYSGTGVSGGMFDPATAGLGMHLITYTYTDPVTGCGSNCTFTITVSINIAATSGPNGAITPSGTTTVAPGGRVTYTFSPDLCYRIADVLVNGLPNPAAALNGTYTFDNILACHTIHVTFMPDGPFTITATSGGNGTVAPSGSTSVVCGGSQIYSITPDPGFIIFSVLVDGVNNPGAVSSGSYTFSNVTMNHTIHATFVTACSPTTVTITVNSPNDFCANLTLTANPATPGTYTYEWKRGVMVVGTSQTLALTTSSPDGVYMVTAASSQTCISPPASYTYTKQDILQNFTILGLRKVQLDENSSVLNGSLGNTKPGGTIDIKKNSSVPNPAFVKGSHISVQNPSNVPNRIYAPAVVALPAMQFNTSSTTGLSNISIPKTAAPSTFPLNYNDVTVKKGAVTTLTGSIFGKIKLEEGAKVTFTSAEANIRELEMQNGTSSKLTEIKFDVDCNVRVKKKVKIGQNCRVNTSSHKNVVFYIDDDEVNEIKTKNTNVTASIYLPKGAIYWTGYGPSNMTGRFIADYIDGHAKNVTWNNYDCAAPLPVLITSAAIGGTVEAMISNPEVLAFPNPSDNMFYLMLKTNSREEVSIKIISMQGKVVQELKGSPDQTFRVGNRLLPGIYLAEFRQGKKIVTVKLLKQ